MSGKQVQVRHIKHSLELLKLVAQVVRGQLDVSPPQHPLQLVKPLYAGARQG